MVHAALAGVPPVELFTVVQAGLATLKFSVNMVYGVCEFDVAEEERATDVPSQIVAGDAEAVTPVGRGLTVTVRVAVAFEQPPVPVTV